MLQLDRGSAMHDPVNELTRADIGWAYRIVDTLEAFRSSAAPKACDSVGLEEHDPRPVLALGRRAVNPPEPESGRRRLRFLWR